MCGVIFPLAPFYGKRACVYCDMDFSTRAVTRQRIILTKRKTLHKMPPVIVNATDSSLKHFDLDGFFKCFGSSWRHWVCECACAYDKLYTMTYLGRKKGKKPFRGVVQKKCQASLLRERAQQNHELVFASICMGY